MDFKQNCWEFNKCGRQPGGHNTEELGVCPVPQTTEAHGINNGINAGRACWAIQGSMCNGKISGTIAEKIGKCMECDFYAHVRREEGLNFQGLKEIIKQLKGEKEIPLHTQENKTTESRPRH